MNSQTQGFSISKVAVPLLWASISLGSGSFVPSPSLAATPPAPKQIIGQAKPAQLTDTTIIPGVKVGPVTVKTTYQDLVRLFGAQRLTDVRPPDADDTEREFGTRVNLGPDWSMIVVWQDKTKARPFQIIDMGPGWQMPGGLKIGMPFTEVLNRLGPFDMVGLGGPYGGVIPLRRTRLEQHFGKIILQLAPAPDASKKFPQAYKAVKGEQLIPSTNPNWRALGMTVKYIIFPFPR